MNESQVIDFWLYFVFLNGQSSVFLFLKSYYNILILEKVKDSVTLVEGHVINDIQFM